MKHNAVVRARVNHELKEEATTVLATVGLTLSDAFRMMLIRVVEEQALPFDPLVPNKETIAAMREARAGIKSKTSVDKLLSQLKDEEH